MDGKKILRGAVGETMWSGAGEGLSLIRFGSVCSGGGWCRCVLAGRKGA